MTAPTVAQVDSIALGGGNAPTFQYGEEEHGCVKLHFKRVYEHYLENNMTAPGYQETEITGGFLGQWSLDEGWHLIPYWNPAMAMTEGDIRRCASMGDGIRIDSLGYKVVNAQLFRCDIKAITGVTELSNTFVHEPYWETYKDVGHKFDGEIVSSATASNAPMTPGYLPLYTNNFYKNQEVTSFAEGLLPRVKWQWNSTAQAPYTKILADNSFPRASGGDSPYSIMSTLIDGSRICMGTDAMPKESFQWVNKDRGAFYPFILPQGDHSIWAAMTKHTADWPMTFPTNRPDLFSGAPGKQGNGAANPRGTNLQNMKHNRWPIVDLDTLVPRCQTDNPVDCYIKLQRLHDVASPVRLAGRVLIEYNCSVTISVTGMGLAGHNSTSVLGNSLEGGYTSCNYAQGGLRRWRAWGIPALAVPALGTLSTGTVRFPAWVPFDNWYGDTVPDIPGDPVIGFLTDWPGDDKPNGLFDKPPLELATIKYGSPPNSRTSQDTWYCLTESWDGVEPTGPDLTRDSFTRNGFTFPALASYETVSGIPPFVWVMEGVAQTKWFSNLPSGQEFNVVSNPVLINIGPPAPAENVIRLFADEPFADAETSTASTAVATIPKKRKMEI